MSSRARHNLEERLAEIETGDAPAGDDPVLIRSLLEVTAPKPPPSKPPPAWTAGMRGEPVGKSEPPRPPRRSDVSERSGWEVGMGTRSPVDPAPTPPKPTRPDTSEPPAWTEGMRR